MRALQLLVLFALLSLAMPVMASAGDDIPADQAFYYDAGAGAFYYYDGDCNKIFVGEPAAPEMTAVAEGDTLSVHLGDSTWEEGYYQYIDITGFMDRFHSLLTDEEWYGDTDWAPELASYLEAQGVFNMAGFDTQYMITGDDIKLHYFESYENLDPEVFPGNLLAFENTELVSATYLDPDDFLLYFGANHVPAKLMIVLDQMMENIEMAGGEMPLDEIFDELGMGDFEEMMAMLEMIRFEDIVNETLSGELAMVVYNIDDIAAMVEGDIEPNDLDVALMVGIKDADYVLTMLERFGAEVGFVPDGETSGWQVFRMMGMDGIGVLVNDEMVIASANIDRILDRFAEGVDGLGLRPCQAYFDMNVAKLHNQLVVPGREFMMDMTPEDWYLPVDEVVYLFNTPEEEALGHITCLKYHGEDGVGVEMGMKKAVVNYLATYLSISVAAMVQSDDFKMNFDF